MAQNGKEKLKLTIYHSTNGCRLDGPKPEGARRGRYAHGLGVSVCANQIGAQSLQNVAEDSTSIMVALHRLSQGRSRPTLALRQARHDLRTQSGG